ncbi:MFS transporter [Promicromonospora sp. NPDC057488]|uniref:MFS transporter n=1 Tax=Promicromonospora sp. NPDC057488 TaxID=3346147 RepID=UPI00366D0296
MPSLRRVPGRTTRADPRGVGLAGPGDLALAGRLWRVLLAAVLGLFPFTIYSTFVVTIAAEAGVDAGTASGLRGLGGVTALIAGLVAAPLLSRWSTDRLAAVALGVLAGTSTVATAGGLPALVAFCLGTGVATALLTPALLTAATSAFADGAVAGRAATLVTATQSLAAVLSGPVIGALAWWQGWAGAMWATAVLSAALGVSFWLRPAGVSAAVPASSADGDGAGAGPGTWAYLDAYRALLARPDLLRLIAVAFLRTASFMGYLSFLALYYARALDVEGPVFTLVWTLSGAAFFVGNYLAGRWLAGRWLAGRWLARPATTTGAGAAPNRTVLLLGLGGATAAVLAVFHAGNLAVALGATAVLAFCHAVVAAALTTALARTAGTVAPTAFAVNAAGMSLGVFAGALLGGAGLAAGGFTGAAVALAAPTLGAFALCARLARRA